MTVVFYIKKHLPMVHKINIKHKNEGEIIWLSNISTMSVSYDCYSRDASCELTYISSFLFQWSSRRIWRYQRGNQNP